LIVSPFSSSVKGICIRVAFYLRKAFCLLLNSILFKILAISFMVLSRVVFPVTGAPRIMIPW
jgi:hypothetical protein